MLTLSEGIEPDLRGARQTDALSRLAAETANLRAALAWTLESGGDPDIGLRLTASLAWFWESRGQVSEGRTWLIRALQREGSSPVIRMRALCGAGWMAHIQQDGSAATSLLDEALGLARETAERWWESWILHLLGRVAYFNGDTEHAMQYASQCLTIADDLDDPWLIAWGYHLLGLASFIADDPATARSHLERSLALREEIGYPEGICLMKGLLGVISLSEGDDRGALKLLNEGLSIGRELGANWMVINWIANMVLIAARHGEPERAARLAGFAQSMSATTGAFPIPITSATLHQGIESARSQLPGAHYQEWDAEGRSMSTDEAIQDALALEIAFEDESGSSDDAFPVRAEPGTSESPETDRDSTY